MATPDVFRASVAVRGWPDWVLPLLLALAALALGIVLSLAGFSARQSLAGAVVAFAMVSWATNALPEVTTGLVFFALAMLGRIADPKLVFSGFAASAFWLVLGGMVIAQAMARTGLGQRIARRVAAPLSTSYARLIAGTILISYGLAFIMPSNIGRITLLMPIMLSIADQLGLSEGRPGRVGVVLAVGFGTFVLSTTILPANVPNLVMAGSIEALHGLRLSYLDYLLLHGPVFGILKAILLVGLICRLFPDQIGAATAAAHVEAGSAPMSAAERRLALILAATLALWVTEGLHGIAPAWVGLAAAVTCLLPRLGVVGSDTFNAVNHSTVLYVAALLGVVAVIADTGLGATAGKFILASLPLQKDANAWNFALLTLLSLGISLVASANAVGPIYTTLATELVRATDLPLMTVLMIQVLGFSTVVFPYQAPPIIVALGLGKISMSDATRLSVRLALVTLLVLLPLDYFWWRFLGMI